MATFFIDDTGVVTTASTDADSIFIQSAAVKGSTILGLGGNDTIDLTQGVVANTSANGLLVQAGEGNDQLDANLLGDFSAGNHTVIGGAGNDTINLSGSVLDQLKGNAGADRFVISGGGTISSIGMGAGSDEVSLQDSTTITRLSLGDGHDIITAGSTITFATAASVIGGNGRDTINLTISDGVDSAFINGGKLQDQITLAGIEDETTVKGMGGADTITLSADGATSAFIAAGDGNDLTNLSGLNVGTTVGGGAGNDTIFILDQSGAASAEIYGGSGNDSISINGLFQGEAELVAKDYGATSIYGGAGADSITFSANVASESVSGSTTLGTLAYSSFSESNLENTDILNVVGEAGISGGQTQSVIVDFADALTAVGVTETQGAGLLNDSTFSGNIAASVLTVSGSTYNVSSITAIVGTVDTLSLSTGKGATVLVTANGGANYLFVQGGTAGTADDSLISLGSLSGAAITVGGSNSAATITFTGQI
jgi:hypothetical protein